MIHKITHRRICAFLLVLLLLTGCTLNAFAADSSKKDAIKEELTALKNENAQIQAQINAINAEYRQTADHISELVEKKNNADQQIALLQEQIQNSNELIRLYSQFVADSQIQLEYAQKQLDELNQRYVERIRAMEENGSISYWQVIFQSKSFVDMLDRMNMVDEIAAADQSRMLDLQVAYATVELYQNQLNEEMSEYQNALDELEEAEAALETQRTESDEAIRQLAEEKSVYQSLLDESEALQDSLMKEIGAKQRELQAAEYEEELVKMALKGQNPPSNAAWLVPVSGYTITSPFGNRLHPIKKVYLMHNGIDMACDTGTPIYATRAGTVTAASYQAGGAGYYVSIGHGDGFASIYMHMTRFVVSKGQSVTQGQLIGYVGSTGLSTGPHLHFGISYGGTYVNPMAYIG